MNNVSTIVTSNGVKNGKIQLRLQREEIEITCSLEQVGQNWIDLKPEMGVDIEDWCYVLEGCFIKGSTLYGLQYIKYEFNGFNQTVIRRRSKEYQIRDAFQNTINRHANKEELNIMVDG